MTLIKKLERVLKPYTNKPTITKLINGINVELFLNGGDYEARQAIEEYCTKKGIINFVSNQPTSKKIGTTLTEQEC